MTGGVIITRPRAHRQEWAQANPQAMIERGGLLSAEDLDRWACDRCMSPLDPDRPIPVAGGPEGWSLCPSCAPRDTSGWPECDCAGCRAEGSTS